MAADPLFSLDQLDPESRALAERAARAAGLSVEEWVTRAILRKTAGQAPPAAAAAPPPPPPPPPAPPPAPAAPARERPQSAALSDKDLLAALSALGPTGDAAARPAAPRPPATPPAPQAPPPPKPAEPSPEQRATSTKELEDLKRALERIGTGGGSSPGTTPASAPAPQARPASEPRAPATGGALRRFPTFSNVLRSPNDATSDARPAAPAKPEPKAESKAPLPKFEAEPNIASNLEAALRGFPGSATPAEAEPAPGEAEAGAPLELDRPLAENEDAAAAAAPPSLLQREEEDAEGEPEPEGGRGIGGRIVVLLAVLIVLGGAAAAAYIWFGKSGSSLDIQGLINRVTGAAAPSAPPAQNAMPAEKTPAPSAPVEKAPNAPAEAAKPSVAAPAAPATSPATPAAPHSELMPPAPGTTQIASAHAPGSVASAATEAPATAPPATSAPGPPGKTATIAPPVPTPPPAAALEAKKGKAPRENKVTSFDDLEKLAKKGDAHAQHDIATLYARGTEIPQDYKKAAYWFRESALQGVASSQYNLGVLYEQGLGLAKDPLESLLWYLSAAEQGYPPAEYNVGVAYADGHGVPKNYLEARKWFEKAAANGIGRGAFNLGVLNELGLGAAADPIEAYKWYKIAARDGEADTQKRIGAVYAKMSSVQRADAERRYASAAATLPAKPVPFEEHVGAAPLRDLPPSASNEPGPPTRDVAALRPSATTATSAARAVESTGTPRSTILEIQQLLGALGYDPGPADGRATAQTTAAIRTFQKEAGLPIDGKASPQLLDRIRKLAGKT